MAAQTQLLQLPEVEPWLEPVNGEILLSELLAIINRFVVLPKWAGETLALWTLHTYAFHLRDVSTYLGILLPLHPQIRARRPPRGSSTRRPVP